jgi:hypothetical protein
LTRSLQFGIFSSTALCGGEIPGSIDRKISERSEENLDGEEESEEGGGPEA